MEVFKSRGAEWYRSRAMTFYECARFTVLVAKMLLCIWYVHTGRPGSSPGPLCGNVILRTHVALLRRAAAALSTVLAIIALEVAEGRRAPVQQGQPALTSMWAAVPQAAVEWLNEKDVVRLLLRAHLHQRQYMEQVQLLQACSHTLQLPCVRSMSLLPMLLTSCGA